LNRLLALCLMSLSVSVGVSPLSRALAQTPRVSTVAAATGSLHGQVADPSGAVIPQASLTVTSAAGVSRTGTSDASGQYVVPGLAPGQYTVTVENTLQVLDLTHGQRVFGQESCRQVFETLVELVARSVGTVKDQRSWSQRPQNCMNRRCVSTPFRLWQAAENDGGRNLPFGCFQPLPVFVVARERTV